MAVAESWPLIPSGASGGTGNTTASFPLQAETTTDTTDGSSTASSGAGVATRTALDQAFVGYGLIRPFRRDRKIDFAASGGLKLLQSAIGLILGTTCSSQFTEGELPWRPEFGSLLQQLRHRSNDAATRELARVYVVDAIRRWEPRVQITDVQITSENVGGGIDDGLVIRLRYNVVANGGSQNNVLAENVLQVVNV